MSSTVLILYASVSGTAEELATLTARKLRAADLAAEVANVADFPAVSLAEFDTVLIIASTWGEGEPPPDAADFVAALPVLHLPRLHFAVLALGSRAYPQFCAFGRRLDEGLAKCGAQRLLARVDCDTKLKADFERWLAGVRRMLGAR